MQPRPGGGLEGSQGAVEDVKLLHAGEKPFDIIDKSKNSEFFFYWFWFSKERMVGATGWVAEVCEAFENFVELEEEGIGGVAVHLGAAATALLYVLPAVEDLLLDLVVDHAGHEGVLVPEDVPQHLNEALRAALLEQHLEDPVNGHEVKRGDIICLKNCHFLRRFDTFNCISGEANCL